MTRPTKRRKAKAPPVDAIVPDRRPVTALDSEDEAGTYAPLHSAGDTGESDDGMLARSPPKPPDQTKGGTPMKPSKKRTTEGPDPIPPERPSEEVGGTDGDSESSREMGLEGDEGSGGGYGRPRSEDEDERA